VAESTTWVFASQRLGLRAAKSSPRNHSQLLLSCVRLASTFTHQPVYFVANVKIATTRFLNIVAVFCHGTRATEQAKQPAVGGAWVSTELLRTLGATSHKCTMTFPALQIIHENTRHTA